ncbi:MAG TPA: cytochrome c oxidase subunit 3, partial [Sphingomonas sp.]|nr:cytochrome c oxidase subunit 3 [Sphingomonas sp.]
MAGAKNHDYHILPPDIVPIMGAFSALAMAIGGVMWMHGGHLGADKANGGGWIFLIGLAAVLFTMYSWWAKVIDEAHKGDHTPVVQLHLRYGMILFIASEVMFFVGWFWAFFDFSLFPTAMSFVDGQVERAAEGAAAVAAQWPPKGLEVIDPFAFPLLNTLILLTSGTTVTWAHHAMIHNQRGGEKTGLWGMLGVGNRDGVLKGLWLTVALGLLFSSIQAYEYAEAPFPFKGINYGAAFFMATGFHGFHVLIGTIFLIVCLVRAYRGD